MDTSDSIDETKSVSKLGVVVNIDVSDEVKLVPNVAMDNVDTSFVCSGAESVCCDTTAVEVVTNNVSTNDSVVVLAVLRMSTGI